MDTPTVERWISDAGYVSEAQGDGSYRLRSKANADGAPFYLQNSENWLLLSMLPVFGEGERTPPDLHFRLLSVNRDLKIVKFAVDEGDAVVLCAELPTESLDYSEFSDAIHRMLKYYRHYKEYLLDPLS